MASSNEGFRPNAKIKFYRVLSRLIIFVFRINGRSRWGNEFIQSINPTITVSNPISSNSRIVFRTGHGRLYWRAITTLTLETETNRWIDTFDEDDIFYDIGSNIGIYSLMASMSKGVKVYSFEVEPLNAAIQHENIHLNNMSDRIILLPIGLSDKPSMRTIYYKDISPADALHSIDSPSPCLSDSRQKNVFKSTIATYSLDSIVNSLGIVQATHIKLDVDGAELSILKGSLGLLSNAKSVMVEVDVNSCHNVSSLLKQNGYELFADYQSHNHDPHNRNLLFYRA